MSEQKIQAVILKWLNDNGFWVIKTIVTNKKGTPDILACSPKGRFVAIEVKYAKGVLSKLQEYTLERIKKNNGIAIAAWDLQTVINELQSELVTDSSAPSIN